MALKHVNRSSTVAFAPMAPVLAAGTMAGAIDLSFNSAASVELFGIDLSSGDSKMKLLGSMPTSDMFNRLSWGKFGSDSRAYHLGILAGGLADGSVNLWNPARLISHNAEDQSKAIIRKLPIHQGSVRGLEFNSQSPNLLASGAEDGEIKIWNIENPSEPAQLAHFRTGGGREISYLSWNPKVGHILASTSFSGTSVVWDLRKQKQIISFTDPVSRRRCSALQWNPDVATQLIVASDEDRSPSLQIWDLRNSISPVRELVSHTKGVLAMAWCPHDSGLLLSCGKDNRTLCWDTVAGEVLYELPSGNNWNFDLQWSPRSRGLLSTSSFDGQISLYSIESAGKVAFSTDEFSTLTNQTVPGLARAPQWLKRPCGASFGFGGKLVSFSQKRGDSSQLLVQTIVTEDELIARAAKLEKAVLQEDRPTLKEYCESKALSSVASEEQEIWKVLSVLFEEDARTKLLNYLNFYRKVESTEEGVQEEQGEANDEQGASQNVQESEDVTFQQPKLNVQHYAGGENLPDEDFFDNIHGPGTPDAIASAGVPAGVVYDVQNGGHKEVGEEEEEEEVVEEEEEEEEGIEEDEEDIEDEEDPEVEDAIQQALVVGNYEGAVDVCLAAGRMADALIIASVGGPELWARTQSAYIKAIRRPYMKVVECIVNNDLDSLVDSRALDQWKETLALLCTYAESEQWSRLCDALARKLEEAGSFQAATLCYICAGNIERTVGIWINNHPSVPGVASQGALSLQSLVEKAVVLSLASGERRISSNMSKLLEEYIDLLAGQGRLSTCLSYLSILSLEESTELNMLKDRIYRSGQVAVDGAEEPHFSFTAPAVAVSAAPSQVQPQPQIQQYSSLYSQQQQQQQPRPPPPVQPAVPEWSTATVHNFHTQTQAVAPLTYSTPTVPPPSNSIPPTASPPTLFVPTTAPTPAPASTPTLFRPDPAGYSSQPSFPTAPVNVPAPPSHAGHPPPNPSFQPKPSLPPFPAPTLPPSAATVPSTTAPATQPSTFVPLHSAPPVAMTPSPSQHQAPAAPLPSKPGPPAAPAADTSPAASAVPPVSAGPPANLTVATADISKVATELKPVVAALAKLFDDVSNQAGGIQGAPPAKRREIEDNSKKLGALFFKLNSADVSPQVSSKLQALAQALANSDYGAATKIQVGLTATDWDECGLWLVALKRMIRARQSFQ